MIPTMPPGCDDPDWNGIWKARRLRHESSMHFDDPSHNWDKKENAVRYDANSRGGYDERVQLTIRGLPVDKKSRVLDIGSGPGTLAIPLSPLVKEITAVEPGAGMIAILNDHIRKEKIANIASVQKSWEDVDISRDLSGKFDVVIASLSLTMLDIREALQKMDAASSRYVYLFWFVDMPFWERMYSELWEPLHGTPYYSGPKADCLFNVLFQMGIYANVEMLPLRKEYRFSSQDEMSVFFRQRFTVTTPQQEQVLDMYLRSLAVRVGDEMVISGDSTFAKIWWEKKAKK